MWYVGTDDDDDDRDIALFRVRRTGFGFPATPTPARQENDNSWTISFYGHVAAAFSSRSKMCSNLAQGLWAELIVEIRITRGVGWERRLPLL